MKYTAIFLLGAVSLQAAVDFIPKFNDKPVPADAVAKIEQAMPKAKIAPTKAQRRVLIVSSTSGYRHSSIPFGKVALEKLGESTGAYETVISDDPANFEADVLSSFDSVILLNTTLDFFMPNKRKRKSYDPAVWAELQERHDRLIDNLVAYVKAGGGLVGIHSATDTCYGHKEFGETIGGYFDGHPWRSKNNVMVLVEDAEHAVNKPAFGSTKEFQIKEEIYQFKPEPYSRDRLRILLSLDLERSDKVEGLKRSDNDYPIAWVQGVGEGRVFYTSIGHNHDMFWNPMLLKHYLAGIQFANGDLAADTTPSSHVAMPSFINDKALASCSCSSH